MLKTKKSNLSATKALTHNGRFGTMAALAPQKRQCEFGSYYPRRNVSEAATAPSRWGVTCKRWTTQQDNETEN